MTAPDRASTTPVAIVGAGPVGLALALGLARQGVRSVVVERSDGPSERSKAPAIQQRTREVFRQWGVEDRFLAAGNLRTVLTLHSATSGRPLLSFDFSEVADEADRPGLLVLEQARTERLLLEAVRESGLGEVRYGAEAVGLEQGPEGTKLTCRQHGTVYQLEAAFVVGCDGAGSYVRGALGLPFDGLTYSIRPMLADVRIEDARDALDWPRVHNGRGGLTAALRLSDGLWRLIRLERGQPEAGRTVPEREIGERVAEALGEGSFVVEWASRFRIHLRSAPRFRAGRVLLAGDAAHVHSPVGGLGMNAGIQDSHNLAWKLAAALRGGDLEGLLDSYEVERREAVVEDVSTYTDVLTRLLLQVPSALRAVMFGLLRLGLSMAPLRRSMLRRVTMIGLGYGASPLLDRRDRAAGRRLPNPLLRGPDGREVRLYDLLPNAPAVLQIGPAAQSASVPGADHVIRIAPGGYDDRSGLLRGLLGGRDGWVLVRPDLHVAWARASIEGFDEAVDKALGSRSVPGRAARPD